MSTRLLPTFHLLVGILVSMALAMADIFETEPLSMLHPVRDLGFRPVNRSGIAAPNWSRWKKLGPIEAFPTNEFWQNVAIGKGNDRSNNIAQLPYVLQVDERDLLVMYPWTLESSDREYLNAFDDVVEPIRLSAVEAQMSKYPFDYYITRYDPVSVSIQWSSTPENNTYRSFSSVIVRGSPYITMQYFGLSPLISLQQELLPGSVYVDGVLASSTICDGSSFLAKTFQFAVIESDTTWKIWFPRSLEMTCSPIKFSLQSREEISGYIRVALVNNCTTGHSKQHCPLNSLEAYNMSEYAKLLDDHVAAIPIAGKIGYHKVPAPEKNSDIAVELVFDWTIHVWNSSYDETSSLLMLALPHHMVKKIFCF